MKIIALCLLTLSLPWPLLAAEQIEVEARFIKINAGIRAIPHDFAKLNQMSGVDLLAAPRATTLSGQRVGLEITHDLAPASFNFKGFDPVPTGITVDVVPEIKDGRLSYNAHVTMRDVVGVKDEGAQKLRELTSHELYLSGKPSDGEWIWIEIADTTGGRKRLVCLRLTRKMS